MLQEYNPKNEKIFIHVNGELLPRDEAKVSREILDSKIHKVKGITRTESFMSIEETMKDGLSLN